MSDESALERGRRLLQEVAPHMEGTMEERYGNLLPGMAESMVEWTYGRHYSRPGLDLRTRYLVTIAAATALGGQTAPQLRFAIDSALNGGASREEIAEVIWQVAVYAGIPAALNALDVAKSVFEEVDKRG